MKSSLASKPFVHKKSRFRSLKETSYYLKYGIECFILRKRKPIVGGIPLTDVCNLQCRHCVIANAGRGHYSFKKIEEWMRLLHKRGARILYIQGGEPFTWQDGEKRINDVVSMARKIGFFKVAMVTNGTFPIEADVDAVWISVDGTSEHHNYIRGEGVFERLTHNLEKSSHPSIRANMTINTSNCQEVESVIRFVANNPKFKGISINFHTPYPGREKLFVPWEERRKIIKLVLELKKEGFPILNSKAGLKALYSGKYEKPNWMINLVEQEQIFECCWGREQPDVCKQCGYGVIAELSQLSQFKIDAIRQAFKLF